MRRAEKIDRAKYVTIDDMDTLDAWIKDAYTTGVLAIDTETSGLSFMEDELVGISLSTRPGNGAYIPLAHMEGKQLPLQDVLDALAPLLSCPVVMKVLFNGKFDFNFFSRYGLYVGPFEDAMLAANSMYGGKHRMNMDELSSRYLGHTTIKFAEVAGGGTFDQVAIEPATAYAAEDSEVTLRLMYLMQDHLANDPGGMAVYSQLEQPLVPIISRMEMAGVKVDGAYLDELTGQFKAAMDEALDKAVMAAGADFNPGSPQQVGKVLERAGITINEQTASGQTATGVEVLEERLKDGDITGRGKDLVEAILDWRKHAKLIGTYTRGLKAHINEQTGRVHPSFGLASTTTGRLACSEPNIQNIPIRTEEGRLIRGAFIAEPGHTLISADYSQIELRVLAHACGDEALFLAFDRGLDIHQATASEVWNIPFDDVTKDQRRNAKAVNFGIIYGQSAWGLARGLGISKDEAEDIIAAYFDRFPGIRGFMDNAMQFATDHGYVHTMAGRKVWFPDIKTGTKGQRGHALRAAVNAPIQGTAADIIKQAMIDVDAMLTEEGFDTRMLLQVHDELVFEAPEHEVEKVMPMIVHTMETAVSYLDVPLLVEAKSAYNWLEAH